MLRTMKRLVRAVFVLVAALLGILGCSNQPLKASGTLTLATSFDAARESINSVVKTFSGLTVTFAAPDSGAGGVPSSDMILAEYSGNLRRERATAYADFSRYDERIAFPKKEYRGIAAFTQDSRGWFLPAAAYTWGLFANKAVLARYKLEPPADLDTLIADCEALKAQGVTPIALSDSHGWPLLGWLLEIDLLRNGPDQYMNLVEGRRTFTDPGTIASITELDRWISKGYFTSNARSVVWTDALRTVQEGKAAFILLGGFAMDRVTDASALSFRLLKESRGAGSPRAVLGSVSGFVFPTAGRNLESALALADRWVSEGASGQTGDGFRIPVVAASGSSSSSTRAAVGPVPRTEVQSESLKALEGGARLVPLMDAELTDQAAYDLRAAFIAWPPAGLGSKDAISALAARMASVVTSSR